ncbi:MAG: PAS domain S-box protein [Limisphaerales bacterium]
MEEKLKTQGTGRHGLLPLFVLICGLAATALATYLVNENLGYRDREHLKDARHQVERTIQSRMEAHVGLLRGGAGLFAANQFVTLEQFQRFHQRLEMERRYPGLQGLGYSVHFPPDKLEALEQAMRTQGLTNFKVWPPGPREQYHSIVFLEPSDERNRQAIGYDMFTEATRRAAMETARDMGGPRLTRKVELVQELEGEKKQPGFLLYLPLYLGGEVPTNIAARRTQLQGFIYSPFRAGDLFGGVVSRLRLPGYAFAVWDGTNATQEALLFQSDPRFDVKKVQEYSPVEISGVKWAIAVSPLHRTTGGLGNMLWVVPLLGVIASVLLCFFTYTEGKARARSELAFEALFNQQEWLETTLRSIGDGVISTDRGGVIQFMNAVAEQLTGWRFQEAQGRHLREIFPITNEDSGLEAENPFEKVIATGEVVTMASHTLLRDRNGVQRCIDDSAAPIRDREGQLVGVILVFREITERRRFERRSSAQHEVTRILAEAPSLSDAAPRLLEILCSHLEFELGVFWLFDSESGRAEAVYIWHKGGNNLERFKKSCAAFKPRKGEGLPGDVWEQWTPIWVSDFSADPRFPRAEDARATGLRTAFAFPVESEQAQFGAMEFFRKECEEQDEELLNVVRGIGAQIGQFIQRKRAEQALAESEALYRAISETAADGIVVIDEQSRIYTANEAMERILGYSVESLIGENLKKLMPARMHEGHDRGMRRFIESGEKRIPWGGVELPGLHRDGTEIPLEISFGAAKGQGGYLFTGFIRDIRRRKKSERQLRETEERFALLVRLAEEYAIIIMGPNGRITTWNPGAQRIFGYSDAEVVGKDGAIFFTEEDRTGGILEKQLLKAEHDGQVLDERWQVRKDGSRFWASGSMVCLRAEDGAVRGFAKILRDITERKRTEESIKEMNQELEVRVQRRTAALQESKEQMEAFSYTVAHDLRAPLRGMQGFAHALMDDYQSKLDQEALDYLGRIMSSAERMDALIQDLLEYSRLSGSDLTFRSVPVKDVVQNALERHAGDIQKTRAEVQVQLERGFVKAHPATLENAMSNLVANALKFSRPGIAPKLTIRAIDKGEMVQISVQDNGIGIAPEHHGRIFRVFERLHGEQSFPGTGIGLAIVKKGVERMGGRVGVESEAGEGSLFWIELPKAAEEG